MNDIGVIQLSNGGFTIVDAPFFPWLNRYTWSWDGTHVMSSDYARRTGDSASMGAAIHMTHAEHVTDHKNCYTIDNTQRNLRTGSFVQNSQNRRKRAGLVSRYKGVHWQKRPARTGYWVARISVNKERLFLGCFKTEEDAAHAYDTAAQAHFGDWAKLNFPQEAL